MDLPPLDYASQGPCERYEVGRVPGYVVRQGIGSPWVIHVVEGLDVVVNVGPSPLSCSEMYSGRYMLPGGFLPFSSMSAL